MEDEVSGCWVNRLYKIVIQYISFALNLLSRTCTRRGWCHQCILGLVRAGGIRDWRDSGCRWSSNDISMTTTNDHRCSVRWRRWVRDLHSSPGFHEGGDRVRVYTCPLIHLLHLRQLAKLGQQCFIHVFPGQLGRILSLQFWVFTRHVLLK